MKKAVDEAIKKEGLGYKLGIYHNEIDKLSDSEKEQVLDAVSNLDSTDVVLDDCVVEIVVVDKSVDLYYLTKSDYKRYE